MVGFLARGSAVRAALAVLVLGALCAGGGGPVGPRARGDLLRADELRASGPLEPGRARSDLVGLWQSVLWADGYTAASAVTCRYDDASVTVTRVWQSNHRLTPDGIVGSATWGAVGERLSVAGRWTVYQGEAHDLPLSLDGDGCYEVYDGGAFHRLHTAGVTLVRCR